MPVSELRDNRFRLILSLVLPVRNRAKATELAGADYMGIGAVFPSPYQKTGNPALPKSSEGNLLLRQDFGCAGDCYL